MQKYLPSEVAFFQHGSDTVHICVSEGTNNFSNKPRPVLVIGVDGPGANNAERHDLQFTHTYFHALPESLKEHFTCRLVDDLEPIVQAHSIEGLMMGE